jgi:hypothetical protein
LGGCFSTGYWDHYNEGVFPILTQPILPYFFLSFFFSFFLSASVILGEILPCPMGFLQNFPHLYTSVFGLILLLKTKFDLFQMLQISETIQSKILIFTSRPLHLILRISRQTTKGLQYCKTKCETYFFAFWFFIHTMQLYLVFCNKTKRKERRKLFVRYCKHYWSISHYKQHVVLNFTYCMPLKVE